MNNIIEVCIAIDIAILGIAYPLLVDKISNIGTNYNSEYLPNVFDSEFPQNKVFQKLSIFQSVLILTVSTFIFKIFSFEPLEIFAGNIFIAQSANILIFILTILLTFCFFVWLNKIMLYQGKASELLQYLIAKYGNKQEESQSKTYILKTINEFTVYAIEKQDIHLQASLLDFYYNLFVIYKEQANQVDGPVYPFDLYYITNEIITTSIDNKNKKLKALEHRASSATWLLGESFKYNKISDTTYGWLWRNIVSSSNSRQLIANYWSSASQYFNYSLSRLTPEYNEGIIANQEELDKVAKERTRFLELNYALGGLLYYQDNFNTMKYILSFSQSQPPSYPLLPQTMDEIFYWFNHFSNEFKHFGDPIDYKYSFPEIDNLGISRNVNHNICLYIALLFLRQFTQQTIYIYQDFKVFHNLTNDLQDLYSYNDRLTYFKNCILKVLQNTKLRDLLEYKINDEEVLNTFSSLENDIKKKIDLTKLNAALSQEKIDIFYDTTKDLITNALDEYSTIKNEEDFQNVDDNLILSINGELITTSKSSFTDNDIPNLNYDSIYAHHIADNKIKYFLPNAFLSARTDRYVIERKQLITALERAIKNTDNKIVVAIRPSNDSKKLLTDSVYKDILIIIPSTNFQINDAFFVLDKKDLPKFESKDLPSEELEKFKLKQLDANYKLYSNVIDINLDENKLLKDEYITGNDTELKVLLLISFIFLIKWRKGRNITMLSLTSPFEERGIVNNIEDIKPI